MSLFSSNDEQICVPFALHDKTNLRRGQIDRNRLDPEDEYGNVEYKLKLVDPSPGRIEKLVTQLKWRIREGQGEAIVFLGVKDNGLFVGVTPEEARLSIQTLERMSAKIGAKMTIVNERIVEQSQNEEAPFIEERTNAKGKIIRNRPCVVKSHKENQSTRTGNLDLNRESGSKKAISSKIYKKQPSRKVIQVLVKRKTHDISEELRVAVLGPTDSGKSSLLGVLSHGEYDNGCGSARLNLFRHRHEIRSGHTSSISQEVFGFSNQGQPLTYSTCLTAEEIIESSSKIVTVIDLAGHQRYMGTTLFGLGSHSPDVVILVISATSSITNATTDLISLALGMDKSLAIVINKTDLVSGEHQDNCFMEIVGALGDLHPEITPIKVTGIGEAIDSGSLLHSGNSVPIFFTSCVTGTGLSMLYEFFNSISPMYLDSANTQTSELQVDETFEVPGIGTVVSGLMIEGTIREGDEMLLGPDEHGCFRSVTIVSLQRHKIPCNFARAGQKCTMAIMTNDIKVRRGMVMREYDQEWQLKFPVCTNFEADIRLITNKKYRLRTGSQVSVYAGNVKQTCAIEFVACNIDGSIRIGLKFTKGPEYLREGSRLILRHAQNKGIGTVCKVKRILNR